MTTARRTIFIGSSVLLLTALLSSCSLPGGDLGGLIPTSGPAALSDTATPTPTALAGDTNGDGKLSEFEKQILAQNAPKDYTLADGTVVSIDPTQPLPAAVVADIQSEVAPLASAVVGVTGQAEVDGNAKIRTAVEKTAVDTGKSVVFVFQGMTNDGAGNNSRAVWATLPSGNGSTGIVPTPTEAGTVALAQAWGATRGYEVIVVK